MGRWIKDNLIMFIISCVFMIITSLSSYIWYQKSEEDNRRFDEQTRIIMREVTERKDADKRIEDDIDKLELMIDNRVSMEQFNEFKARVENMDKNMTIIQSDIKLLLRR